MSHILVATLLLHRQGKEKRCVVLQALATVKPSAISSHEAKAF